MWSEQNDRATRSEWEKENKLTTTTTTTATITTTTTTILTIKNTHTKHKNNKTSHKYKITHSSPIQLSTECDVVREGDSVTRNKVTNDHENIVFSGLIP